MKGAGRRPEAKPAGKVPLERALSKLGLLSRSQTRAKILTGGLRVNGRVVTDPDFPVTPEKDRIESGGRVCAVQARQVIMLNKPKGYVTTARDEKGRKTVYALLPPELRHLHAVGRLDMHTTGLLLFTNDTRLSAYLTDPANAVPREYAVTVKGRFTPQEAQRLRQGITDGGEVLKARAVTLRKISSRESHLMIILTEGKNREVRRMFKALGHEVTALKRIAFGPFKLGQLLTGGFRSVDGRELKVLAGFSMRGMLENDSGIL